MSISELDENCKLQAKIDEMVTYFVDEGPKALGSFVICDVSHSLPFLKERKLDSGIVIPKPQSYNPEHNKESVPFDGIVVGVGPDCKVLAAGDHICLPLNNNSMWMINWKGNPPNRKYIVMLEESIRARF